MYKYRSTGQKFAFRADKETKLFFAKSSDTDLGDDKGLAMHCEGYVDIGVLERIGANPRSRDDKPDKPSRVIRPAKASREVVEDEPAEDAKDEKPKAQPKGK